MLTTTFELYYNRITRNELLLTFEHPSQSVHHQVQMTKEMAYADSRPTYLQWDIYKQFSLQLYLH